MRTCSRKNTGENLGRTEAGFHPECEATYMDTQSPLRLRSVPQSCPLLTRQFAATPLDWARVVYLPNFSALETPAPSVQGFF
jgi:hypothetical protein